MKQEDDDLETKALKHAEVLSRFLQNKEASKLKETIKDLNDLVEKIKPKEKKKRSVPISDKTKLALAAGREKLKQLKSERKEALVNETKKARAEVMKKYTGKHHASKIKSVTEVKEEEQKDERPEKIFIHFA